MSGTTNTRASAAVPDPRPTTRDGWLEWAQRTGRIAMSATVREAWASAYDRNAGAVVRQLEALRPAPAATSLDRLFPGLAATASEPAPAAAASGGTSGPAAASPAPAAATAAASSVVMDGAGEFPAQPNAQRVSMSARDYEIMRVAANARIRDLSQRTREQRLSAALSSGRIAQADVGAWRARYNASPGTVSDELAGLPAGRHRASSMSAPFGGTGDEPAAAPAARSAAPAATASQVVSDGNGGLAYRGFPVAMGASGEPCVFTESGWMTVASFEATDLGDDDLRAASFAAHMAPGSPMARTFAEGPSGGSSMRTTFGGR